MPFIAVPAAEHDRYWLAVEVSRPGDPFLAGYVRGVVVAHDVGKDDPVRNEAVALADQLGVELMDQAPRSPTNTTVGDQFPNRANERLQDRFSQGRNEG